MIPMSGKSEPKVDFEHRDIDFRRVMAIIGWLALGILIVYGVCAIIIFSSKPPYRHWKRVIEPIRTEPPEPRLQTNPSEDLTALHAEEDAALQHYGWIDRANGIVHIPIDQAVDILASRGLPARSDPSAVKPSMRRSP